MSTNMKKKFGFVNITTVTFVDVTNNVVKVDYNITSDYAAAA